MTEPVEPLALRPEGAAKALSISVSQVYFLISKGKLDAKHPSPQITLIPMESIRKYLEGAA